MRLKTIVSPDMEENCYFVIDESSNQAIVIDPGAQAEKLCRIADNEGLIIKAICLTHCHYDHVGACERLRKHTGAPVLICDNEAMIAESKGYNLSDMFGDPLTIHYDRLLNDGDEFAFGSLRFRTISTPGHTPGGVCFYFEKEGVLFSGDTLFYMSVGRTDFPGGDSDALIESIKNKLFTLPEDTVVYCGHGRQTTIGFEKKYNFINNM